MIRLAAFVVAALCLVVPSFGTVNAQTVTGTISVKPLDVKGLVVGRKIIVDQAFADKYKVQVKAPFEFIAPKQDEIKVFAAFPPDTGGEYMKLSFASPDKKLIENLRFVPMTIPLGNPEDRIKIVADLLTKQGFQGAVKGFQDPELFGARKNKLKDYDVVEVAGQVVDPAIGPILVWLVGILNPDSEHCLMAFANFNPALSEVKSAEDLGVKGIASKAVKTFKYIQP